MERLIKRLIKRLTALLAALVLLGGLCAAQAETAADPEEIMTTNFALAILHLEDGYGAYESPEILQAIVDCLKN